MKNHTSIHAVLGATLLFSALTACGDNGGDTDETVGTTSTTSTTAMTTTMAMTSTTENVTTTDPSTTTDTPTTTVGTTTGGGDGFVFPTDPYSAYTQIDRHGAVEAGTAGIAAAQGLGFKMGSDITIRDAYNASNPEEDAASMWLPEIAKSIMFFHGALDDDIMGLGLVPATFDETVAQAGPVILPDTIKYDPSMPTAYPNGRKLTDPVVDITLMAVLLKIDTNLNPPQPLSLLADLPLNPPANDVPFKAEFPYLAPPHAP